MVRAMAYALGGSSQLIMVLLWAQRCAQEGGALVVAADDCCSCVLDILMRIWAARGAAIWTVCIDL